MSGASNYPPGVTGCEPSITGDGDGDGDEAVDSLGRTWRLMTWPEPVNVGGSYEPGFSYLLERDCVDGTTSKSLARGSVTAEPHAPMAFLICLMIAFGSPPIIDGKRREVVCVPVRVRATHSNTPTAPEASGEGE